MILRDNNLSWSTQPLLFSWALSTPSSREILNLDVIMDQISPKESFLPTSCRTSGDCAINWGKAVFHWFGLLFPILTILLILNDTKWINPKVLFPKFTSDLDSILECLRQITEVESAQPILIVGINNTELLLVAVRWMAPAMKKRDKTQPRKATRQVLTCWHLYLQRTHSFWPVSRLLHTARMTVALL